MSEETQAEIQKQQQEYSQLCAKLGHNEAQIMANQKAIVAFESDAEKIRHQLETLFKKNQELQNKINFETKKETKVEPSKGSSVNEGSLGSPEE